ncbi:hypothetical protein M7I_5254 [Glarea lozoyensis 74030]|uniref:DUF3295 domain-containing protein n=1 Tax=Glarea lozoyensis (strain ATCC 74030 / MF5533) TaxID=1104152 RepID=H0ERD5_GLAL7|nr:hypothetical protein M7I_5254 [Glarea lozoyensis 74030]
MPARLSAPILTVDVGLIHKVDTRNVENLFSMWAEANATTPAISTSARSSEGQYTTEIPSLSTSLDSLADEEAIEFDTDSSSDSTCGAVNIPFQTQRTDSISSRVSRGRERHITPDDLEKMVITIKEKKTLYEPLALSTHSYLAPQPKQTSTPQPTATIPAEELSSAAESASSASGSDRSSQASSGAVTDCSEQSATSVVRGFSPSHVSSSQRSIPLLSAPYMAEVHPSSRGPAQKKQAMFALGGSSGDDSFSEQPSSINNSLQPNRPKKKAMFSFGGSSNEDESSLPHNMTSTTSAVRPAASKKTTSFQEEVANRTIHEDSVLDDDVFETDDEDDVDESAIDDDDDSSDWEDSVEDSGNPSIDEKTFFQRVDSRPNLTTRRSLITTMLHQNDRATALAQAATTSQSTPALQRSRTTSPNGPSLAASPDSDDAAPLMMRSKGLRPGLNPIAEIPRSSAQPIIPTITTTQPQQLALSPRSTRKKMINDELTVSLRQHLVWEHRQKSSTANAVNAVLQRRHTTQDMANLKQYPDKVCMDHKDNDNINASWNQYFGQGLNEYHSQGW